MQVRSEVAGDDYKQMSGYTPPPHGEWSPLALPPPEENALYKKSKKGRLFVLQVCGGYGCVP